MDENEFESLRLSLSRMPRHAAPEKLIRKLKKEYIGNPLLDALRSWFVWPVLWKPVGVLAVVALLAGVWVGKWKSSENNFIDAGPLLAAHARYQSQSLVPQKEIAGSNFGAQLASYYGDEN